MAAFNLSLNQEQILLDEANRPFASFAVNPTTLVIRQILLNGNFSDKQPVFVKAQYTPVSGGDPVTRVIKTYRYYLDRILGQCLRREEFYLILPCFDTDIDSIIVAIQQCTGIALTRDDIFIKAVNGDYVELTCQNKSLGWFGDFCILVTDDVVETAMYPYTTFVDDARTRFLALMQSSVNPALLHAGTFNIKEIKDLDRKDGSNVMIVLEIDNMLRPGALLRQVIKRQYTTRTIYRKRIDLSTLPDYQEEGIFYQPLALPITIDMALSFVNIYFDINIDRNDVAMQFFNPTSSSLILTMKKNSPFYKGTLILNVI